jgi:hypothetical protein
VVAVEDRLEVQMASCRPSGGAYSGDNLAGTNRVAGADSNCIQVVVGGDESVAVVDFNPVAASPGMPSGSAHHSRIRCVYRRSAGGCIVLAKVEITRGPRQWADPETEGRAGMELLEGCHQESSRGSSESRCVHFQR